LHDIEPGVWTPQLVADELLTAIKWANRASGRVGPAGFKSTFASLVLASDEFDGWPPIVDPDDPPRNRRSYTPQQVSRMERVLEWQMRYLRDHGDGPARVLRTYIRARATPKFTFGEAMKRRGWSRATAYRGRDKALATIAMGLTADGIAYGQH